MPFDPYWEWFKIPPDRRPPSHRELLGVGPDETDLKQIREAARKRHEHLKQFVISPQEEVAAHAKRLLKDVGAALAALRRAVSAGRDDQQPKPGKWRAEIRDGTSDETLPVPIILGSGDEIPPVSGKTTPAPVAEIVSESAVNGAVSPGATPAIPPPIPPQTGPGGWHGPPPQVAPPPVQTRPTPSGDPTPAGGATPLEPQESVLEGVAGADGHLPIDIADVVLPPPLRPARPGRLRRRLRWLAHTTLPAIRRLPGRGLRLVAACPRAIFRWVRGLVRRMDGLLRLAAGEENAILHGFFRVLAIGALAVAIVFAVPPLVAGLAKLASALVALGDGRRPPEPGPVPGLPGRENSIGMQFVLIPAGEFSMGSEDSDALAYPENESPRHPVKIIEPYYLGVYEVTVGQFRRFVEETRHETDAEKGGRQETWKSPGFEQTDDHPVAYVSWNDAVAFCEWLSQKEGQQYRLPTEAEWEYACRAQDAALVGSGGEAADVGQYAWWQENADQKTHPVGGKQHSAWGLHDMLGNVAEWCQDWYQRDFYGAGEETDPQGPASGTYRVLRGGSATSPRKNVRPGFRSFAAPDDCSLTGFRVVLIPAKEEARKPPPTPAEGKTPAEAKSAPVTPTPTPHVIGEPPKEVTNSIGMKLVLIPAGEFMMGSRDFDPDARSDEKPQHRVRITQPFYLGVYEVTQAEYERVMGSNPSHFRGDPNLPVETVSWQDAQEFCRRLSAMPEELAAGCVYRLPTEAEWEYACRAGTTTRYSFGDNAVELGDYAWWMQSSGGQTHVVGQKKPNAWGLYDMHGNVWEWCADWYDSAYYREAPVNDPIGPDSGTNRVLRGSSWCDGGSPGYFRCALRNPYGAGDGGGAVGFRVVRLPTRTETERLSRPRSESKPPVEPKVGPGEPSSAPQVIGTSSGAIINSIGMKLVLIPADEFMMGSPDSDPDVDGDETPQHRVQITKPFYLGVYEVTVGQFRQFAAETKHRTDAEGTPGVPTWRDPGFPQEDDHPVVRVSWNDACAFAKWLTDKEGRTYRLPTEAQWEYACRAGTTTAYSFGDDRAELAEYAWFDQNATHPVGRKKPNAWGLYDVYGSAEEWCADWYDDGYYKESPLQDPTGPGDGKSRVVRGMNLFGNRKSTRSAYRFMRAQDQSDRCSGFRVAMTIAVGQ